MAAVRVAINGLQELLNFLGTRTTEEVGLIWQLEEMQNTLVMLEPLFHEAQSQRRSIQDKAFGLWYAELRGACYDIQDMLDHYLLLVKQKLQSGMPVKVWFHKMFTGFALSRKMQKMRKQLNDIAKRKEEFNLTEFMDFDRENIFSRETTSFPELVILGRDADQRAIVDLILDNQNNDQLFVLPIVGMGGLGKTTLAKLIFNDNSLRDSKHFDVSAWAYVSTKFDLHDVGRHIISSFQKSACSLKTLEGISQELRKEVLGKRFLIVLDDVWTIDLIDQWEKLTALLIGGLKGSTIVVTTRLFETARDLATRDPYILQTLSDETIMQLFQKRAFKSKDEMEMHPNLVRIGKEIVKKFGGVPLAAMAIGSMLCSKKDEKLWLDVKDGVMREINDDNLSTLSTSENKILSSLKLSYNLLPPHLKLCFAYCSIFPKGYIIDSCMLTKHWISLNFITPDTNLSLEDIAEGYLSDLISMSFLDKSKCIYDKEVVMHDLMHDLAQYVSKDHDIKIFTDEEGTCIMDTTSYRYISLYGMQNTHEFNELLKQQRKAHAIFLKNSEVTISDKSFSQLTCLRVLEVEGDSTRLPSSIKNFRRLRYFSASRVQELFISNLGNLVNLQYLKMMNCFNSIGLPKSLSNLTNLLHLQLNFCYGFEDLPECLGELINLKYLHISRCRDLVSMPDSIVKLQNLLFLYLAENYGLKGLPECIGNLKKLEYLNLSYCQNLSSLPESICNLQNLLHLDLSYNVIKKVPGSFGNLKNLENLNLSHCQQLLALPESICDLSSLLYLNLSYCSKLTKLPESIGNIKNLQYLDLSDCCKVVNLPKSIRNLVNLAKMNIFSADQVRDLPELLIHLTRLRHLSIPSSFTPLLSTSIKLFTNLKTMELNIDFNVNEEDTGVVKDDGAKQYCNIDALQNLNMLEGQLTIRGLEIVKNPNDAEKANLIEMHKLRELNLIWNEDANADKDVVAAVFQSLQPSSVKLRHLAVRGYIGRKWPVWMMDNHYKLEELSLTSIENIALLFQSIGKLRHLRVLRLAEMASLSAISYQECSMENQAALFPSLQKMYLVDMHNLKVAWLTMFPNLNNLEVDNCPCLSSVRARQPSSILELTYRNMEHLADWLLEFSALKSLIISGCPKIESLPKNINQNNNLQSLGIENCSHALIDYVVSSFPSSGAVNFIREDYVQVCIKAPGIPEI